MTLSSLLLYRKHLLIINSPIGIHKLIQFKYDFEVVTSTRRNEFKKEELL